METAPAAVATRTEVVGHANVRDLLRRAKERGRLAHAYLFVGSDGVGKRTLARSLAAELLGTDGPVDAHPDFFEVRRGTDPKTGQPNAGIRIEQAREVRAKLSRTAFLNGWTVCVLDDAHLLTTDAANALLKTLEEPHEKTVFVLLATSAELVMPTIRSRCQTLVLGRVPENEIGDALARLGVPSDDVALLARMADGCPGRAFAFVDDRDALDRLRALRDAVIDLPDQDIAARWATVERLFPPKMPFNEAGRRALDLLDLASEVLRDVMLGGYGQGDAVIHADARPRTARMLGGDPFRAARALGEVRLARLRIEANVNPRAALQQFVATL